MTSKPITLDDGREVSLCIRGSTRARRILLHVGAYDGKVELVLPPGTGQREGLRFARTQTAWIARQLDRLGAGVPFVDGAVIPLLGKPIVLRRVASKSALPILEDGELSVGGREETLAGRVQRWFRARALEEIRPRAAEMADRIGRAPRRISVRDTRSRWGSCSRDANLSFSWRLVMAPEHVLTYVVAHEVAHLRELNHGPKFWKHVDALCGDSERARTWLRRHGAELHRYGRTPD